MTLKCVFCKALTWKLESNSICCNNGKVQISFLQTPPEPLFTVPGTDSHNAINFQESLPRVFFHTELLTHTNKSSQHPECIRQAALEVINYIPVETAMIYTDGSKNEIGHTGSGVSFKHGRGKLLLNEELLTTAQFSAPK
ncbi:hypothetical protein AVEN_255567-1 [Araneus ventricosus]|uniref:RNase H type-1 domain-containing protein n=1 Tax=Araneus ventricosus TaxID=182803 RepID=A0A4Y2UQW2_ARAVE|nr:hypothetical protein AVEN_255567-1 [Araneus ventricosus]